jgi:hypothetical protein
VACPPAALRAVKQHADRECARQLVAEKRLPTGTHQAGLERGVWGIEGGKVGWGSWRVDGHTAANQGCA